VALAELSAVERSRLEEAFRATRAFQERGAFHFRTVADALAAAELFLVLRAELGARTLRDLT
jgi:hypothetical protein